MQGGAEVIAAIYARKSIRTECSRMKPSRDAQVEEISRVRSREGLDCSRISMSMWDDGISGAEFKKRPRTFKA
jgi:hypothetical protein